MRNGRLIHRLIELAFTNLPAAKRSTYANFEGAFADALAQMQMSRTVSALLEQGSYASKAGIQAYIDAFSEIIGSAPTVPEDVTPKEYARQLAEQCEDKYVKPDEFAMLQGAADGILRRQKEVPFLHLIKSGFFEYTLVDKERRKARPDILCRYRDEQRKTRWVAYHIKTTGNGIANWERDLYRGERSETGIQSAHYKAVIDDVLNVESEAAFIVVETKAPFNVRLFAIRPITMQEYAKGYERVWADVRKARRTKRYHGFEHEADNHLGMKLI